MALQSGQDVGEDVSDVSPDVSMKSPSPSLLLLSHQSLMEPTFSSGAMTSSFVRNAISDIDRDEIALRVVNRLLGDIQDHRQSDLLASIQALEQIEFWALNVRVEVFKVMLQSLEVANRFFIRHQDAQLKASIAHLARGMAVQIYLSGSLSQVDKNTLSDMVSELIDRVRHQEGTASSLIGKVVKKLNHLLVGELPC